MGNILLPTIYSFTDFDALCTISVEELEIASFPVRSLKALRVTSSSISNVAGPNTTPSSSSR